MRAITSFLAAALAAAAWLALAVVAVSPAAAAPPCGDGRYVVEGESLLPGGVADRDEVVIETPDEAPAEGPQLFVRSGCFAAPVRLSRSGKATRVDARLPSCNGAEGESRLRARIQGDCRMMKGTFWWKKPGAARKSRRAFTARLDGSSTGLVAGSVSGRAGEATGPLPGATVLLVDRATGLPSGAAVQSDDSGRFRIHDERPGSYDVCARAPGFVMGCHAEPVVFSFDQKEFQERDIVLTPQGGAIHGRVQLADGSVCFHDHPRLDAALRTVVSVSDADVPAVQADLQGRYVLAGFPGPGTYTLEARCAGAKVVQTLQLGAAELEGKRPVDLVLPNSPPKVGLLAAALKGVPIRTAPPGATVEATAEVEDPDGDTLKFHWWDGAGLAASTNAPKIDWKLLSVPARNLLNVLVTDGRGGVAEEQLVLDAGTTQDRFIGAVRDASGPVAGALVVVDGQSQTTDAQGEFRLAVPMRERHVLNVRKAGYALLSKAFYGSAMGLDLDLRPAQRITIDPTQDIDLQDGPSGPTIHIPAGSLVDAQGTPASGPLFLDLYAYDPTTAEAPGDRLGRDPRGAKRTLRSHGALSVEITDASGKPYNLAPDKPAEISFKARPVSPGTLPQALVLSRYDEQTGEWVEKANAPLVGDRYLGQVASFSSWNGAEPGLQGNACLRVEVDDNKLERPFHLRVDVSQDLLSSQTAVETIVTDKINAVYFLPPNAYVTLLVSPKNSPGQFISIVQTTSGPNVSPAAQPYPYAQCKRVVLEAKLPANHWLTRLGYGSEAAGEEYYASIGARPTKDTFEKWLAVNGFEPGYQGNDVVFYNPNELGLGRRLNCRMNDNVVPGELACFVTKFGEVGGSPTAALDDTIHNIGAGDTVAMEYTHDAASLERIVKFYVYRADGALQTHTAFDTEGSIKHVPNVCLHCHGNRSNNVPNANGNGQGDVKAKFVTLDPHAYRYPSSGPYTLANQQLRFRQLNEMIALTFKHQGPGWQLMNSIYPDESVYQPGTQAQPQPVPPGWQEAPDIWKDIIKPSCRTCHMYQDSIWSFSQRDAGVWGYARSLVCGGEMPNAMQPMLRLWRSAEPFLLNVFTDHFGLARCVSGQNQPPTVAITAPADDSVVSYGGLGFVTFQAQASDAEDGSTCCSIKWIDDAEGTMGYGKSLMYVFGTPGTHKVRAIAYDSQGAPSLAAKITVEVDNDAPIMSIAKPTAGQTLYRNAPFKLEGSGFDLNEAFLALPCSALTWSSSKPGDPTPTGCQPVVSFASLGTRTLTLTGIDSDGVSASTSRTVNVVDAPPNSPPLVVINQPNNGQSLDPWQYHYLIGTAYDPDDQAQPSYQWRVKKNAVETVIGAGKILLWRPSDALPFDCGSYDVELRLYATDPDGTSVATATISIGYPPC